MRALGYVSLALGAIAGILLGDVLIENATSASTAFSVFGASVSAPVWTYLTLIAELAAVAVAFVWLGARAALRRGTWRRRRTLLAEVVRLEQRKVELESMHRVLQGLTSTLNVELERLRGQKTTLTNGHPFGSEAPAESVEPHRGVIEVPELADVPGDEAAN